MRKYDSKNKRNIGIIIVICILVTVVFSFFLIKVINMTKTKYEIGTSSLLFDIDKNAILLNESGTIKKKWNKKYYLTYKDEQYQIGNHVIIFNNNEESLALYGQFYEINKKSEVNITKEETKLNNLVISRFYKLEDRKYLIVDADIKSEDGLLKTNNYLIVELDKLGNAILYNNSLNVKTFKETKIVTTNYTFDIANELLIYENETVDLKEILGTTNEYQKEEEKDDDMNKEEDEENNTDSNLSNGTGNDTSNNQPGNNSGDNQINNNPGNDNDNNNKPNDSNEDNDVNNSEDNNVEKPDDDIHTDENGTDISDSEIINQTSMTSILRITPTSNTMDIDYVIFDKANKYFKIFVEVESEFGSQIVYLNKSTTNITLTNLYPGTNYKLIFKYSYYENEELKESIIDEFKVKTLLPNITIVGTRIGARYIGYEINTGTTIMDSAILRMYVDGVKQDFELSINDDNLSGNFNTTGITFLPDSYIELSLEEIYVYGQKINKEVKWIYKKTVEKEETPPVIPDNPEDSDAVEEGENNNEG